jgi:type 1 fimbria pilin
MLFAPFAVKAGGGGTIEGGTITFVGTVLEPTCSPAALAGDGLMVNATHAHPSLEQNCSPAAIAGTASNARPYSVNVVPLSNAEPDRVLSYFANYVRTVRPGSANPMLITQTYE